MQLEQLLGQFLEQWGYLALVVGTFVEGETVVVLGGFAAHRGYLSPEGVVAASFLGSFAGDQLFFFLGRRHGTAFIERFPSWRRRAQRAGALIERYNWPLILGFRFLYGLRTVTPFAIGMSAVPTLRFVLLNAAGALAWATVMTGAGYIFGEAMQALLGNLKRYELALFLAILGAGAVAWVIRFIRRRR
jgi:membrane protein DedA with SNARE-associated domain